MRKLGCLGFVLVLLLALGGLTDFFVKGYTEDQMAVAIENGSKQIGHAEVSISSFPFVARVLTSGTIRHINIKMTDLTGLTQQVEELDVAITGLQMDRDALLGSHHIKINAVDKVAVSVLVSARRLQELADKVGVVLAFGDDSVSVNGIKLNVGVAAGLLTLQGGPFPALSLPLPTTDLSVLPCTPTARVTTRGIFLTCSSDRIPKLLLDAIGSKALRDQFS